MQALIFDAPKASVDCIPESLDLIASGDIKYPDIAPRLPLSDAPDVFRRLADNPAALYKVIFELERS